MSAIKWLVVLSSSGPVFCKRCRASAATLVQPDDAVAGRVVARAVGLPETTARSAVEVERRQAVGVARLFPVVWPSRVSRTPLLCGCRAGYADTTQISWSNQMLWVLVVDCHPAGAADAGQSPGAAAGHHDEVLGDTVRAVGRRAVGEVERARHVPERPLEGLHRHIGPNPGPVVERRGEDRRRTTLNPSGEPLLHHGHTHRDGRGDLDGCRLQSHRRERLDRERALSPHGGNVPATRDRTAPPTVATVGPWALTPPQPAT